MFIRPISPVNSSSPPQEIIASCILRSGYLTVSRAHPCISRHWHAAALQMVKTNARAISLIAFTNSLRRQAPELDIPPFEGSSIERANSIRRWMLGRGKVAIEQCKSLNFTSAKFRMLPPEIGLFCNLEMLCLSRAQIASLPEEMVYLTKLEQLYLDHTNLINPRPIAQLRALKVLNLYNCQLKSLPQTFDQLSNLEALDLTHNRFSGKVPVSIYNLSKLRILNISDNRFDELSKQIRNLIALRYLNLSDNLFETLPRSINTLRSLEVLNLKNNLLEELPPLIFKDNRNNLVGLTQLKELNLDDNHLYYIDPEFRFFPPGSIRGNFMMQILLQWHEEYIKINPEFIEEIEDTTKKFNTFILELETQEEIKIQLAIYLGRIREIEDYQAGEPQAYENAIIRTYQIIQNGCNNRKFREFLFQQLADGMTNCGDRVLVIFNNLEVAGRFCREDLDLPEFTTLCIQEARYYIIQQWAQELAREKNWGDTVEIILAFHLRCKSSEERSPSLELPITTELMSFPDAAGCVTPEMIEEVKAHIRAMDEPTLLSYSPHWQERIYEQQAQLVAEVEMRYYNWLEWAEQYDIASPEERAILASTYAKTNPDFHDAILVEFINYLDAAQNIARRKEVEVANLGRQLNRSLNPENPAAAVR